MPTKKFALSDYHRLMLKRSGEGGLPYWRQLMESALLWGITGNGPGYYQLAGFWKPDYPWREKVGHLNQRRYEALVRERNPMEYRKLSQHKLPEKALLSLLGIPTPRFLGYFHPGIGRDHLGAPLRGAEDLERLFTTAGVDRICLKLVEGWSGRGFEVVDLERFESDGTVKLWSSGEVVSTEELAALYSAGEEREGGTIVEVYMEQHPAARALNPSSVNTARVWVVDEDGAGARVELAYMRIGRSGSLVDNQSSGGIVAPLDPVTGVLEAALDGLPSREEFPVHPDHGAPIAGAQIPDWEEAKEVAVSAIRAFPRMGFSGLDIAFSTTGPRVLELNTVPDRAGAAFVGRALKDVLGRRR